MDREVSEDNKIISAFNLQLKAVENKIEELQNIKITLKQNINQALAEQEATNYIEYFNKLDKCLQKNREIRYRWLDKWEFDSWAKNYDNSVRKDITKDLKLFEKYDYVLETLAETVQSRNAESLLDIGCGTGNLYVKLNDNINYTGMDQSIEMLLQAKRKYPNIKLRLGNFLDKPFIQNEFDAVVSSYAFHHLKKEEKERAVNLMLQYLKPKGVIIIADLMFLNEAERMKQKDYFINMGRKDLWDIIEDEYYTDIKELQKYTESIGSRLTYKHIVNFTWIIQIEKLY